MPALMRRAVIAGVVAFAVAVTAGVSYAVILANVAVPSLDTGTGNGTGATSCQTGSTITFTWPSPTWDNTNGEYSVSTLNYSNITNACVTLGTADLTVNIVLSGQSSSAATATATNMSAATGSLTLSAPIEFEDASTASIRFFVKNT